MTNPCSHPWCPFCADYDPRRQACRRARTCLWRQWDADIAYDPSGEMDGGTGKGYPALIRNGAVWEKAWLKAQQWGKTGGYSWEQTTTAFAYEVCALIELQRRAVASVPRILKQDAIVQFQGSTWVYYVMTRAEGDSWQDIPFASLPPAERHAALFSLCAALCGLHRAGFGHYDLKPQNIHFDAASGRVTLIDLGSSKGPDDWRAESPLNRNHAVIEANRPGSLPYVSPEQARGRLRDLTPASDVYVYGLLFCQAVLGGAVVGENHFRGAIEEELVRAGIPVSIARLVARGTLAIERTERQGVLPALLRTMAAEGWGALPNPKAEESEIPAIPPLPPEPLSESVAAQMDDLGREQAGPRPKGVLALAALAALAVLGYALLSGKPQKSPPPPPSSTTQSTQPTRPTRPLLPTTTRPLPPPPTRQPLRPTRPLPPPPTKPPLRKEFVPVPIRFHLPSGKFEARIVNPKNASTKPIVVENGDSFYRWPASLQSNDQVTWEFQRVGDDTVYPARDTERFAVKKLMEVGSAPTPEVWTPKLTFRERPVKSELVPVSLEFDPPAGAGSLSLQVRLAGKGKAAAGEWQHLNTRYGSDLPLPALRTGDDGTRPRDIVYEFRIDGCDECPVQTSTAPDVVLAARLPKGSQPSPKKWQPTLDVSLWRSPTLSYSCADKNVRPSRVTWRYEDEPEEDGEWLDADDPVPVEAHRPVIVVAERTGSADKTFRVPGLHCGRSANIPIRYETSEYRVPLRVGFNGSLPYDVIVQQKDHPETGVRFRESSSELLEIPYVGDNPIGLRILPASACGDCPAMVANIAPFETTVHIPQGGGMPKPHDIVLSVDQLPKRPSFLYEIQGEYPLETRVFFRIGDGPERPWMSTTLPTPPHTNLTVICRAEGYEDSKQKVKDTGHVGSPVSILELKPPRKAFVPPRKVTPALLDSPDDFLIRLSPRLVLVRDRPEPRPYTDKDIPEFIGRKVLRWTNGGFLAQNVPSADLRFLPEDSEDAETSVRGVRIRRDGTGFVYDFSGLSLASGEYVVLDDLHVLRPREVNLRWVRLKEERGPRAVLEDLKAALSSGEEKIQDMARKFYESPDSDLRPTLTVRAQDREDCRVFATYGSDNLRNGVVALPVSLGGEIELSPGEGRPVLDLRARCWSDRCSGSCWRLKDPRPYTKTISWNSGPVEWTLSPADFEKLPDPCWQLDDIKARSDRKGFRVTWQDDKGERPVECDRRTGMISLPPHKEGILRVQYDNYEVERVEIEDTGKCGSSKTVPLKEPSNPKSLPSIVFYNTNGSAEVYAYVRKNNTHTPSKKSVKPESRESIPCPDDGEDLPSITVQWAVSAEEVTSFAKLPWKDITVFREGEEYSVDCSQQVDHALPAAAARKLAQLVQRTAASGALRQISNKGGWMNLNRVEKERRKQNIVEFFREDGFLKNLTDYLASNRKPEKGAMDTDTVYRLWEIRGEGKWDQRTTMAVCMALGMGKDRMDDQNMDELLHDIWEEYEKGETP